MVINDDAPQMQYVRSEMGPAAGSGSRLEAEPNQVSSPRLTRRRVLSQGVKASLGVTVLGSWLAACGGAPASTSGPVTIQFAALVDTTGEQTAEIKRFNDLHAGKIHVDYVELPSVATDQYSKFVNAFRSQSSTPDVVQIDVTWPAQFATPGWLAPIDQYVTSSYLNQFWPSARTVGRVNGHLYGIQRYMDIGMLYYRTDLVEKYGGSVPQTREEMQTLAERILAAESSQGISYGYLMPGKKIEAIVDEWLEFLWGAGGSIGEPGKLQVNGALQVDALQYMHDLIYKFRLAPTGTSTYAPNDILALFSQGKAPFMRNWVFAYAIANTPSRSKVAGKVGVAPTLATSGHSGHGCTGGWVLAINANSQYKDAAWTFIDYLLSKETQTSMALNAGLIPSRPDVVSDASVQAKVPYFKQIGSILNSGQNRPTLKNYNQFTTPLQAAINSVLSNQASPSEALSSVQTQVASLT
ncbi:ABC transporter substrate-binding protein [Thermogemmatispora aurantia]|jgi:multiple sugar transport system substrate-binding protein|uniref:ABC transporter substrate-binding protein n=2 Tax=Thermogemmatispora TaxID=768669 RepID=A0A5J4KCN9_9CHLR|nr:ABC transporter substrate-binding protein [Thermogemmatispora aurantia]GER83826.1 ABC transporter substrate-binding protein [Thermogemmatispora aurantia]